MAFVRSFLGCIPLRAGVWVLSLVGFLLGMGAAAGSWFEVQLIGNHPVDLQDKIALFTQAIVFSLYGLFSLLGLFGGIMNHRVLVHIYSRITAILTVLMFLSLGFTFYYTFRLINVDELSDCTAGDPDELIAEFCGKGWSFVKGAAVLAYVVALLVQCYALIIAVSFVEKCEVDEAAKWSDSAKFGPLEIV